MTVSNCGHDESNRYSGGKAGDQSGTEWYLRSWYDFGQNVVLIHQNAEVNNLVAAMAKNAANNDNVGYDQGERTTFYAALKATGWNVSAIKTKCEADCSSGVAAIVIGAGNRLGDKKLAAVSKDCWTGNLRAALVSAGYKAYTDSKYLTSDAYLPKGAICLNESRHVNIQVTNGAKVGTASSGLETLKLGSKGGAVKLLQAALNVGDGAGLDVDGDFGNATLKAVKAHQKAHKLDADGIVGKATWESVLSLV